MKFLREAKAMMAMPGRIEFFDLTISDEINESDSD
jgi:hypothetical protein